MTGGAWPFGDLKPHAYRVILADQQPAVPRATRQFEIVALRSLQLADRVAAGQLGFLEAVHLAYDGSIWAGPPAAIDKSVLIGGTICGDDIVQATIAAAFANARRPE